MDKEIHVVMFPWFAMGHMIPYLHLANKLAATKGYKTTFLLPKKALSQLSSMNLHPTLITLKPITVPHVDPLPPGTETASDIPLHLNNHLATAMDLTRPEVELLLMTLKPNLVFYDMAHWVPEVASNLPGVIKTVFYSVVCAASLAIAIVPSRNVTRDNPLTDSDLAQLPQGYPSDVVVLRGSERQTLLGLALEFGSGLTFYERINKAIRSCDAIAFRTCKEVEESFCNYIASQYQKPVFLTGPVLPEQEAEPLEKKWEQWLGRFEPGSVVFCAFGSQFILEKQQLQELLLGFEMAGRPFFVAVKPPSGCVSIEEALPEGFADRVKEIGIVCGSWVQQPQILAHPSIGCFVNHCGFGSMWESLMSKSQIVLIPQLGDQILNARIIAGQMKVAVEVEKEESGWVSKESLCESIKSVMDEGSQLGELIKSNHSKWRDLFLRQGFMSAYIDDFAKDLEMLLESD